MSRKIDTLVAEHVMSLELRDGLVDMSEELNSKGCWREPKPYSTDIAAAWEVLEKYLAEGNDIELMYCKEYGCWNACLVDIAAENGDTAPLAICLAALKAKGIDTRDLEGE